jgi:transketolase
MAAGLAASGMRPVAYTITPFITYRTIEQIRVDLCYHNFPVVIVGVGSGMGYASLGATHHSCEDIAMLRALPNMTVLCPADPLEVLGILSNAVKHNGPVYIRLGKKGEPNVHDSQVNVPIGKGIPISSGSDLCILATGTITHEAKLVAQQLSNDGIQAELISMPTVKPLDNQLLKSIFSKHKLVVTIEEHSRIGGFGSAILEWSNDNITSGNTKILRIGTPDEFFHLAGEREYAFEHWGLSIDDIIKNIKNSLG